MYYADGFGNYIYILFVLAYMVYSIIKASKKISQNRPGATRKEDAGRPVQPPAGSGLPKQPEDDFKKMLEELMGGLEKVKTPPKQKASSQRQNPATPKVRQPAGTKKPQPAKIIPNHPPRPGLASQPVKPLDEEKHTVAETAPFVSHPEVVQKAFAESVNEESAPEIDFDARKAAIYSEIFKRPDW